MSKLEKIYIDTEFIDNGETLELISIGLVKESGEGLYLISSEFQFENCDDWLLENVLPNLEKTIHNTCSLKEIKQKVIDFCGTNKIQFYGYYSAYDWVIFCQLFGRMIDIPINYSQYCHDLKQDLDRLELYDFVGQTGGVNHNAFKDAKSFISLHKLTQKYLKI